MRYVYGVRAKSSLKIIGQVLILHVSDPRRSKAASRNACWFEQHVYAVAYGENAACTREKDLFPVIGTVGTRADKTSMVRADFGSVGKSLWMYDFLYYDCYADGKARR